METRKIMAVLLRGTFGLLLLFGFSGTLQATPLNLTDSGPFGSGDIGASTTVGGLTLSALSGIDETDPTLPVAPIGHVNISSKGAGVLGDDNLDGSFDGSTGVSGKGKYKDEVLILSFDTTQNTSSFQLTLADYKFADDEVQIYLDPIPGLSTPSLFESDFSGSPVSGLWTLDFSLLDATFLANNASFDTLYIRNTGNEKGAEFYVNGVDSTGSKSVPEPATFLLLGPGLIGLVGLRRKFKKS